MHQPIQVEFQMTPESYQRVTRELVRFSFRQRRLKIMVAASVCFFAVTLLMTKGQASTEEWLWMYLPALVVMLLVWLGIFYYLPGRLISKHQFPEPHPLRYTFSDAEVSLATATSESTIQWAGYLKAEETEEWLLLFQNKTMANPVLKSALSSSDLEQLRGLLRAKGLMK